MKEKIVEINLENIDEKSIPKEFHKDNDEELIIKIQYGDYGATMNFGKEYGKKVTLDDVSDAVYNEMLEALQTSGEMTRYDEFFDYSSMPALRKFLLVTDQKEKISMFEKKVDKQIDYEAFPSELEWVAHLRKIQLSSKLPEEFSEDERGLYKKRDDELTRYNIDNIYNSLFKQHEPINEFEYDCDERKEISLDKFPKGLENIFEVDENGNPTGKYNWDYFIALLEKFSGDDITEISNYYFESPIHEIFAATPVHIEDILLNMDDISHLCSSLIECQEADLNCPRRLRENPETIYDFFSEIDENDAESCFDFMDDKLKTDKKFLERIFQIRSVQDNDMIVDKIKPELFEDDDEFAKKMIKCWGVLPFISYWDKLSHLWDEVAPTIPNEQFERVENYYYDEIERIPKLKERYNQEFDKRFDTSYDEAVLDVMRMAVGKTINNIQEIDKNKDDKTQSGDDIDDSHDTK